MYATQLNHLLQRGAHASSLATVLVARPNPEERESKGQLALLLEVPGNSARLQVAVNEFLKHVEATYYNSPSDDPESSLERALRQANVSLGAVAGMLDKRWPEKTTMIVLVHHDDQVYFATAGSAWGVLLTPNRITTITDNGNRHANVNPIKPFSAISSGSLQPDSVACFANLTLLDYIAQEKFRKLCWEMPPLGVVQRLEELLGQASPQLNIMVLIIRRMAMGETVRQNQPESTIGQQLEPSTSERSLHKLASQRGATAQLLSVPSLRQSLGSKLYSATSKLKKVSRLLISPTTWTTAATKARRSLLVARTAMSNNAQRVTATSVYWWPPRAWLTAMSLGLSKIIRWLRQINRIQRTIFVVVILACLGLAVGVMLKDINRRNNISTLPLGFATDIASTLNSATNSLIYGNEQQAIAAITSVRQRLDNLDSKQQVDASLTPLKQQLNDLQKRLSRVIDLGNLAILATFPNQTTYGLALANNNLWTITGAGLIRIDLTNGSSTVMANNVTTNASLDGENKLAYAASNNNVIMVTGATVTNLAWQKLATHQSTVAIMPYNARLYALDPNGQVFRYQRSGQTFDSGVNWLKQPPVSTGLDIAVDGSVYLLTSNNIMKFTQGKSVNFNLPGLYPALTQAVKFAVGTKAIYILEPKNQRIIVLTKTGQLDHQYSSPDLASATALTVDTGERAAYVATGATVRRIDLNAR
jgi:hypothetical protein